LASAQPIPLPAEFVLKFAAGLRRPAPGVLIGGAPLRVLRLTPAGAALVDRWRAGDPVGPGQLAGRLAARLVEAGVASPAPPAAVTTPTTAVVIPVLNDQPGLDATLAALDSGVEVIVVDDGSAPPMVASRARVIRRAARGGPAAARNSGWRSTGADLIAFVDAGCAPSPGALDILTAHFADLGLAAAAPRIQVVIEPGTPAALARYERKRSPLDMGSTPASVGPGASVSYLPSTALVVRRSDLEALDGFDESMRFGEDVDLIWRLRAGGRRVVYDPAAAATHAARPTWTRWLRQRYDYGTSAAALAARHGRAVAPVAVSPWSTAAWALLVAGHPVAGAAVTAGSALTLARRGGGDRAVRRQLAGLAVTGSLKSGLWLAKGIRRAWLPTALVVAVMGGRRHVGRAAIAAVAIALLPDLEPGTLGIGLADDLAYQAGVWAGVIRRRSAGALLPRW
jgi:mycofactocin system glycosyltransferase